MTRKHILAERRNREHIEKCAVCIEHEGLQSTLPFIIRYLPLENGAGAGVVRRAELVERSPLPAQLASECSQPGKPVQRSELPYATVRYRRRSQKRSVQIQ